VCSISFFTKMQEFHDGSLKNALESKLKQIALKVYLIGSQDNYKSFSLDSIQTQFGLEKADAVKQVSKLIMD